MFLKLQRCILSHNLKDILNETKSNMTKLL